MQARRIGSTGLACLVAALALAALAPPSQTATTTINESSIGGAALGGSEQTY